MTAAPEPQYDDAPLTNAQTRIRIPSIHRSETKRLPQLQDALDFWQFSGAAANVAMQLAVPGVGRGVLESKVESGSLMAHPWKRLRTTASYLAVAILGSPQEQAEFRAAVNIAHRQRTRADFDIYWNEACREVAVDPEVRAYIDDLLRLRMIHWYLRVIFGGLLRFLTAGYLAPHFRAAMGVEWSAADQRRFEHLFVFVGFVNRFVPKFIRFAGTTSMMRNVRHRMRKHRALI